MDTDKSDFDFLIGDWEVLNKRLSEPFSGSDEWVEFPARLRGSRQLLGGLANVEQYLTEVNGQPFEGVSIRLFNPARQEWTIYWMDDRGAELVEQVVGSFVEREGERVFVGYGTEIHHGETVKMRFVWAGIGPDTARWEQAYWVEARDEWETNWVMEMTRTVGGGR